MRTLFLPPLVLLLSACGGREDTSQPATAGEATQGEAEIARPAPEVRGEEITYTANGTTLEGYLAYDAAQTGPRPGVLIVHEWWGHNDYVRERARMLAALGYTAFALDMYGDGKLAEHPDDAQQFMMAVLNDRQAAAARFTAAKELLEGHATTDPARTAAIGYCFGGGVVLHMARTGADLDGVASFHGSLAAEPAAEPGTIRARILVLHGADDPMVPPEAVDAFKAAMAEADADLRFIAYPGAVHSFTNPGATAIGEKFDMPLRYDEAADKASWAELERFLEEIFAGS